MKHRLSRLSPNDIMIFEVEDSDDTATSNLVRSSKSAYVVVENEGEIPLVIFDNLRKNAWVTQDHMIALEAQAVSLITGRNVKEILENNGYHNAFEIIKQNPSVV